ncbi:hypothetical protein AK830_g2292 [Neonectria ditissima]|uniref:C2H2-type domain-containing protein n=1 Tax=Neonectria ditissima TaxID=78410 RepID=A0A0P7BSE6_9HYPO|nr:hypothetical protein AK830_g2292 [Neonectria ditissima]
MPRRRFMASAPNHGNGPTTRSTLPLPLPFPLPSPPTSTPVSVPIPVPLWWMDASSKQDSTSHALFQPSACDFTFEPPYCNASALPSPTPELSLNDLEPDSPANYGYRLAPTRALSIISCETQTSSSAGSLLSPVQTDRSDTLTARSTWSRGPSPLARHRLTDATDDSPEPLLCLGPQCQQTFTTEDDLKSHVESVHTFSCNWAGCDQPSFASREGLIWHVQAEHLLVCPFPGCTETSLQSIRALKSHITIVHKTEGGMKEWQLTPTVSTNPASMQRTDATPDNVPEPPEHEKTTGNLSSTSAPEFCSIKIAKRKCEDQLRSVLEKRSKKNASTPRAADSPTDLVRGKASRLIETASFPLVYEHAILPFLSEFLPKWAGPHHVVSVMRGKTPQMKRICIMTRQKISRPRKMIIVRHVQDLLPEKFRRIVSFVFTLGEIDRIAAWARGLSKEHMDDICVPRNPYFFQSPCMGDSIGIRGNGTFENSTATLGPSLIVGGGNYWLGNFHPFLEAYQQLQTVEVEHPSLQDRERCLADGHDAMAQEHSFKLGNLAVTSGLNLQTTRITHDPYWEECDKEQPLVVTDWSLIAARTSHANLLRRFPSETQTLQKDNPITSTTAIIPGAYVTSSGRTSGHQRGQICEIPAYVSGEENGTRKATREWFIEEPYPCDNEEEWIRGGIGIEGDSGAAVIDSNNNSLVGQLWGRNRYWGPGPRHTFFTPISDIFDDIQEKCGQQTRPQLPQHRDEADCFPPYPSCRQCYDLRTYLDSRRTSRISLQSMIMGKGDADQDLTSIEAVSELATPGDSHRFAGVEEAGSSFNLHGPFCPGTPAIADIKSPYALEIDAGDLYGTDVAASDTFRKRGTLFAVNSSTERQKRQRVYE